MVKYGYQIDEKRRLFSYDEQVILTSMPPKFQVKYLDNNDIGFVVTDMIKELEEPTKSFHKVMKLENIDEKRLECVLNNFTNQGYELSSFDILREREMGRFDCILIFKKEIFERKNEELG